MPFSNAVTYCRITCTWKNYWFVTFPGLWRCSNDSQCKGSLVCGAYGTCRDRCEGENSCCSSEGPSAYDVDIFLNFCPTSCHLPLPPPCTTSADVISGFSPTKDSPGFCLEGEGDCDTDLECNGTLVCGTDNCAWGGGDDCCRPPQVRFCGCYLQMTHNWYMVYGEVNFNAYSNANVHS